jgi:uncharacterized protein (DUF1499 family)
MKKSSSPLSPCPSSPNCVSSLSEDRKHFVEPLQYGGSRHKAIKRLVGILGRLKRVHLTQVDSDYIHAEFRSSLFGFVDDVEFWLPDKGNIIHVKSASRTGYSDFGVNRRRVEQIRSHFDGQSSESKTPLDAKP